MPAGAQRAKQTMADVDAVRVTFRHAVHSDGARQREDYSIEVLNDLVIG